MQVSTTLMLDTTKMEVYTNLCSDIAKLCEILAYTKYNKIKEVIIYGENQNRNCRDW